MGGLDLADAAAQAREALREMADEAARKASADKGSVEEDSSRGGEGYPADDIDTERSVGIDPDPNDYDFFEEASEEASSEDSAPREEL